MGMSRAFGRQAKAVGDIGMARCASHTEVNSERVCSRSLSADSTGELDVLGENGHAVGMESTQVCILENTD
jgi:hypothetical protein